MDAAQSPDSTVVVLAGIAFAYSIIVLLPLNLEPTSINILLAGSIAICAMILPGISGSFEQVMIYIVFIVYKNVIW